jgi:hypothetical protein
MLLEAQIEKERAQAAHFAASAGLHQAKMGTEGAKAAHLQSDTDLKNLNFIEQESGVTQERAKELHGEQARSQAELKLVEHQLQSQENERDRQNDLIKEYVKSRNKE